MTLTQRRISSELLRDIAASSLTQHQIVYPLLEPTITPIQRDVEKSVHDLLVSNPSKAILLQGPSGIGKSTLARQIGQHINESKQGIALWIPAEKIANRNSLSTTLLKVLRDYKPTLNQSSSEDALKLSSKENLGVVLIIDDLNRADSPNAVIDMIRQWIMTLQSDSSDTRVTFLIPIWPGLFDLGKESNQNLWTTIEVSTFSHVECERLSEIQSDGEYRRDYQSIFEDLQGDPLFCGLVSRKTLFNKPTKKALLIREILNEFLTRATDTIRESILLAEQPSSNELDGVIKKLVRLILDNEDPHPKRSSIKTHIIDLDLLQKWSAKRNLGWFENVDDGERWRWKHNRLRDAIIGQYLALFYVSNPFSEIPNSWFSNPGLAEPWAMSLVFLEQEQQQIDLLSILAKHQSIALAEVLRLQLFPQEEAARDVILNSLRKFLLLNKHGTLHEVEKPAIWDTFKKVASTDDPLVLALTDDLEPTWHGLAARLRNGDTRSGLNWIQKHKFEFLPNMHFPLFENSIKAYTSLRINQRHAVAQEIVDLLHQEEGFVEAAFIIAGYVGWEEPAVALIDIWNGLSTKEQVIYLLSFVWMMSRCGTELTKTTLEDALQLVKLLLGEQTELSSSERYFKFTGQLEFAFRRDWTVTSPAAEAWKNAAKANPEIQRDLYLIMRNMDHPIAVVACVRWQSQEAGRWLLRGGMPVSPLPRNQLFRADFIKDDSTRKALWEIVTNPTDHSRSTAFLYWRSGLNQDDLSKLQSIPDSDALFDAVLRARLTLRDNTAVPFLIARVRKKPMEWCDFLVFFMEVPGTYEVLIEVLEDAAKSWNVAELLRHLPSPYVERIIEDGGEILSRYPITWYHLWRTDVRQALLFVQNQLAHIKSSEELRNFFAFGETPFPISQQMLDCIAPYLSLFEGHGHRSIAWSALKNGYTEWAQQHLLTNNIMDSALIQWTSKQDIWEALDQASEAVRIGKDSFRSIHEFQRLLSWDEWNYGDDPVTALREWLTQNMHPDAIKVGSILLYYVGSSTDIAWWKALRPQDKAALDYWQCTLDQLTRLKWQA